MEQVSINITLNMSIYSSTLKPNSFKNIPTVYPASSFNPQADADVIHTAMQGLGTDELALINILCHRTCDQRASISHAYKAIYGKV
jgi:annexin A7/11